MHNRDAVFLEDLCPKLRVRRWRQSLHTYTGKSCIYCGKPSESIDHVLPRSRGGLSITENCVPACLSCNGHKSDADAFDWYRRQRFYDPRRAMAIRAWMDGDLRLALRLLQWAQPDLDTAQVADLENRNADDDLNSGGWCRSQIAACCWGCSGASRNAPVTQAAVTTPRRSEAKGWRRGGAMMGGWATRLRQEFATDDQQLIHLY
jgi:hypothetical protein